MSEKERKFLERSTLFLKHFKVDLDLDYIPLTDSGNSLILNPNTEWKDFLGNSINSIARAHADLVGKPVKWV